ncbi:MAG TPA: erythromycin biosynthesis sensory transduction protein eryC1 [Chloroflexi bacterium]|nr:erythromycin biosynthesis sensory transduction protein eryC1 [Chloroflexota bacterium]
MHQLPVPLQNPVSEYRLLQTDIEAAVHRCLEAGVFEWGPEVPAFETEFAELVGARHAVSTNSGLAALKLALRALGIGSGDEVITVPNSDIATTSAIHAVGAHSVWVDVEPDTLNMDPNLVEAAITARTRAILPVHLYGHPAAMPALSEIARRHNLLIVEDACLALGAFIEGRHIGSWSDIACYSHAPSKHLGAIGTGGTATTNDAGLAERLQLYAGYGQPRERSYTQGIMGLPQRLLVEGYNERLDEIQAAVLRVKLPYVFRWIEARRANAQVYGQALRGSGIDLPVERQGYRHSYRNYVIQVAGREQVQRRLTEAGVATAILYVPPLHLQPVYRRLGYKAGSFPVTEAAADRLLSIPVGPTLTPAQRDHVVATLLEACGDP